MFRCLQNNEHCSCLNIEREVRRENSFTLPIHFIVEALSAAIKFDPDINSLNVNNIECLLNQYADDTALILDDSELSLNRALKIVNDFSTCSGS